VRLIADPGAYATFAGFQAGSGVTKDNPITVLVDSDKLVKALFQDPSLRLSLTADGTGSIAARTAAFTCPPTCSNLYMPGETEELRATPSAGAMFDRWINCPNATGPGCIVTMNQASLIYAYFTVPELSVTIAGNSLGRVTSNPAGIDCTNGTCKTNFAAGRSIDLRAAPGINPAIPTRFDGWSEPSCARSPPPLTCTVTMDRLTRNVQATFTQQQ
jgi:hypothetical protein